MPVPLAPPVEATLSQIFRAGAVFLLLIRTKINPALLVLCGAVAGLFAFGLG